jgi:hypothetical protein
VNVATFPPASLAAQLAELKREKKMRGQVYPHWIASRKMTQHQADYQMNALNCAIATFERLVIEEAKDAGSPADLGTAG